MSGFQLVMMPGVEHVGGDMFVSVPKGDAIFMKVSFILFNGVSRSF